MAYDLAFLGAGNMAEAIARGLIGPGGFSADRFIASGRTPEKLARFQAETGITTTTSNVDAVKDTKAVMLGVKPQMAAGVLPGLGKFIRPDAVIISIMAGVTSETIEALLGGGKPWRIVRTMPNTPILVGQGAVAVAPGRHATAADVALTRSFFEPAAVVVDVTEEQIHAVTAVSGSGPAYVFYLIEQMTAAGVELGLPPEQADLLAKQTLLGAATMAKAAVEPPAELRRRVTSPNGTTHAAITKMEATGVGANVRLAMKACYDRSVELGKGQ
ncbi:MAG: pyrroline-5-carboxylate reductase [Tepidisphaeraceae bacterium]